MDALTLFYTASLVVVVGLFWIHLRREKVQDKYKQYWSFFRRPKEIETADKVPAFVDTFYNLVTDIYEWGWGQSFHFSPAIPGKSHRDATRLHEEMVADLLGMAPVHRVLDAGCGVGGPMRAIAAHSGSNVVGITINEYQVNRARIHNKKAKLDAQCDVVCGNFLQMPFDENSFDGAYSIEATCHAPKLEEVYGEIFRVLKPGCLYVSYEWVTTELYRGDDPEHIEIIQGIERGDALPGLRSYDQIAKIAREVGFEVVKEMDLAKPPANPWWSRLKMGRIAYWRNHILIMVLAFLGIAPKGVVDVHEMLFKTADYLVRGGDTGIFTPMHMILCRKPEKNKTPASA
ncbi:sterol methyltransferase 2 [Actinidia rufa]|uniref:Methyltransferase n=1 Tax=Actinidia rufa TaxID=165716 RepID=A0A7J0F797_9ERIC|nr:sterol methyltransferase 2 [Actinidia rufa]